MVNISGVSRFFFVAIIFCTFLYLYTRYLEKHALYFPFKLIEAAPSDVGLEYQDVSFKTEDDINLHGWFIPNDTAEMTLIFSHGNGGNISHRLDKILFFHRLGMNIFIFDYRGYGKSQGSPSEEGLYQDIQAAYEYIKSDEIRQGQKRFIIIYGESLGGAVALDLASKQPIDGLILESTFTNVKDMARVIYPVLPVFLIKSKFDSISKIAKINVPKLCMHSRDDDIIPFSLGKRLFDAASQPKEFMELQGQHNDAFFVSEDKVKTAIEKFLEKLERL